MKLYLISIALLLSINCQNRKADILGMWLLVQENEHLVFDCHEVISFDKEKYVMYDCDIDYSIEPTVIENGKYSFQENKLYIKGRNIGNHNKSVFRSKNSILTFDIEKVTSDSLVVSDLRKENKLLLKFVRVDKKINE